jgi:hypothetical protein
MYFHDVMEVKGKHATIMRDGVYQYLASEIGLKDRDPNALINVYRPYTEVIKASDKFKQYQKLPITVRHPDTFLNLNDAAAFSNGEATQPELKSNLLLTVIDCIFDLRNQALKDYQSGTRQLSCGWEGEFEKATEGPYEFIQRFKDINHIAIVPVGRAGEICKINDGGNRMDKLEKIKALFASKGVQLTDEDITALDALQLDKKKTKDEEEAEEKEEKENKDKKKNKDDATQISDAIETGKKEVVTQFTDVLPVMSQFKASELAGKNPNEIKSMFIKKVANTDIKDSDPGLNVAFQMALKNFENPAWKGTSNHTEINDADLASQISGLNFANKGVK